MARWLVARFPGGEMTGKRLILSSILAEKKFVERIYDRDLKIYYN